MERGDISGHTSPSQVCVFEGLLAAPPSKNNFNLLKHQMYARQGKWDLALSFWTANELPLKSMVHHYTHLGISTDVVTFLSPDAVEPIYRWLLRKVESVPNILYYSSPSAYADDLKYNRSITTVYVPDQSMAFDIGMRATTVSPLTTWGL